MRSLLLICLLSIAGLAAAEDPVVDAPARVARLSFIEGQVSIAPAGTEEWAEAVLNRPLTNGDRLWVDSGARAELQVGSATIHLDSSSGLSIVDLDDNVMHLQITEGSANIRVLRKRDNESIEVETPNATVTLLHPGEYHIDANSAGDQSIVRTRSGASEVSAGQKTWKVNANEEGVFDGTGELAASINPLGPRTAFEEWTNDRNRQGESSVSSRYVSNEVIGYQDLDHNGYWANEPSYGYVWRPTYVAAGWAPYRFGRWVWVSPWGWSWVDNASWGFAPFHYGRWAYVRSAWCWVPGPRYMRPVYAPALVAWTGSPGFNVAVSFGSGVGWFPLGPREVYVPGYHYSRGYFTNVNVSNTIIVSNNYINNIYTGGHHFDYRYGRTPYAVTVVDRDHFVGGRPIDGHLSRIPEPDLRRWNSDPRPPALAPSRDSVMASRVLGRIPGGRAEVLREPPEERPVAGSNQFAAGSQPSARVPFDVERRAIEANGGRPVSRSQLIASTPRANVAPVANSVSRPTAEANGATPSNAIWRARGEQARAQLNDSGHQVSQPSARPRDNRDTVNSVSTPSGFSDRPSWAQYQRDESQRVQQSRDDARRAIPEQRQWSSDDTARAQRARESAARSGPAVNSFQQQSSSQISGTSNPALNPQSSAIPSAQQWRGDNRPPQRVERGDAAQPVHSYSARPQTDRDVTPSRTQSSAAQPQQQYRSQPAEPRHVEQPRSEPQPQRQQPSSSSSSDHASRQQNNSSRSGSDGGRQNLRFSQ